jgi:hypothetical protein
MLNIWPDGEVLFWRIVALVILTAAIVALFLWSGSGTPRDGQDWRRQHGTKG